MRRTAFLRAGATDVVQRRRLQRRRRRADQPSRSRRAAHRRRRHRARCASSSGRREEADRHRQLLFGLDQVPADRRVGAAGRSARRAATHDRVLPRSTCSTTWRAAAEAEEPAVIPFLQLTPGRGRAPCAKRPSIGSSRAAGSSSGPSSTPSSASSPPPAARRDAAGVGTGTDALAIALRALGIGPGDEVITSPLSAAYTALAIMMAGARPVFADIDPDRLTLDPDAAAAAVTSRTAAIMPVHLYGQPADMTRDRRGRLASQPRHRRGLLPGAPGHVRRPSGRQRSARPPPTASIRPRISARSGTAAR